MPNYEFQLVGGQEVIEKFYPVAECPDIGTEIQHDGKTYRRIFSFDKPPNMQPIWKEYDALSLPREGRGYEKDFERIGVTYGKFGRVHVSTQAQEREIMAITGRKRD